MLPGATESFVVATHFESEIGLAQVTESHHNHRCADLSHCWIKMKFLHEDFQEDIVQQDRAQHGQEIAEKL